MSDTKNNAKTELSNSKFSASELRIRAQKLNAMTQGELREALGWSITAFNAASALLPDVQFKLDNGERVYDRAAAVAFIQTQKRDR